MNKIENAFKDFIRNVKQKIGYDLSEEVFEYGLYRNSFIKIKSDIIRFMLYELANKKLTKKQRAYLLDLWINLPFVGVGRSEFPINEIVYTNDDALIISISEDCPDAIEKRIKEKIINIFYDFMDELKTLYYKMY